MEWSDWFDWKELVEQFKWFDQSVTGKVKIYHLINVLKYYLKIFSEDTLKNLQFDLECLSGDGTIDYEEFISVVFRRSKEHAIDELETEHIPGHMSEWQWRRTQYLVEDYNEVLLKINSSVKQNLINLGEAFKLFDKDSDGEITWEELK